MRTPARSITFCTWLRTWLRRATSVRRWRLNVRALRASGDFDAYWDFHEAREYERNHAQRYAEGTAPPVSEPPPPPSPPRLRRVK